MQQLLIILLFAFGLSLSAQTEKYSGTYQKSVETQIGERITYTLNLNSDGTYVFHMYRNMKAPNPEENLYGRGSWKAEKNLIFFHTEDKDIGPDYSLNLNASKAKVKTTSPSRKATGITEESLRFYASDIYWVKGIVLDKKN
tara:strand:- start:2807 stop:3232 length:426 start_codon:yes stop_codon:yes gene_type:complete